MIPIFRINYYVLFLDEDIKKCIGYNDELDELLIKNRTIMLNTIGRNLMFITEDDFSTAVSAATEIYDYLSCHHVHCDNDFQNHMLAKNIFELENSLTHFLQKS